jgi:hypothetical protein
MTPLLYGGSIFAATERSSLPCDHVHATADEFARWLYELAQETVPPKESRPLVCASYINGRRLAGGAVVGSSGLWLDHDGKDGITWPEALATLLPFRHIAVNTFNHTAAMPKYRVWIPSRRWLTADEYKMAWRALFADLTGRGAAGFDRTPSSAASIFYLPSRSRDGLSIWHDHGGDLLDVDSLIARWRRIEAVQDRIYAERAMLRPPSKATATSVSTALERISPDERDTWFRVGCALWHEFGEDGRAQWDEWSRRSAKFNHADQGKTWRSIRSGRVNRPITIATILKKAKDGR